MQKSQKVRPDRGKLDSTENPTSLACKVLAIFGDFDEFPPVKTLVKMPKTPKNPQKCPKSALFTPNFANK